MDVSPPNLPPPDQQPTSDYGTLGPGSDIAQGEEGGRPAFTSPKAARLGPFISIALGVMAAVLVGNVGSARAAWRHLVADLFSLGGPSEMKVPLSPAGDIAHLDRLKPQKQAETLLELAVGNSDGAVDQISSRVDHWRGRVRWNPQLASLTTAALNSNDLRVRGSGIEVELVAYGLSKNPSSIDELSQDANSPDHARKIWALWSLGALANRGVETERAVELLTAHLKDSDEDSRRWTVEGLALVGTGETIAPLLRAMHDDSSALVRERAACSVAESGMLTHEQRLTAVPQLLSYSDDPALDAQTHAWAFQALGDITGQRLGNDSAAWRNWYENSR